MAVVFKEIKLPQPMPMPSEAQIALADFNRSFGDDELRVVMHNGGLLINLREIDLTQMRGVVKTLTARHRLSAGNVLSDIEKAVSEIKSYGLSGGKRNYVDYNKERKVQGRSAKEQNRGKLGYARGHNFSRGVNLFPDEFADRIVSGDSAEILQRLPDNCVDLIFTSPPYNFGLDYEKGDDDSVWNDYFARLFGVFDECIRVLKFGGRIAVNVQPLFSDYVPTHHIIGNFFIRRKLIWKSEILWEKNNYNCKYTAWGSWKSPASPYLKYSWEFVEVFCKGDLRKEGRAENADISADEFKKWVYGKWSIAPERGMMEKYGHPAMFPEELAMRVLKLFSFRGDVVLDPFNGAGTTTVVAKKTGRQFLGVDISEEYCKTAERRLAEILL